MRPHRLLAALALASLAASAHGAIPGLATYSAELDARWDFRDPAASEQRFRGELAQWPTDDPRWQIVMTQIARTQGLRRQFAQAHATLDAISVRLDGMPSHVRVRYLLERGRVDNSAGARERALPLFAEALALAECAGDEFYAVDAAHMLGIAAPREEQLHWNLKALALAHQATDPRAQRWEASLYNNIGWNYHDRGDPVTALAYWEKALAARQSAGDAQRIREARWAAARGMRSTGRLDEAQAVQQALASEQEREGKVDASVYEELAEIALVRGDAKAARSWANTAYESLKADPAAAASEPQRLSRLAAIAAGRVVPGQ